MRAAAKPGMAEKVEFKTKKPATVRWQASIFSGARSPDERILHDPKGERNSQHATRALRIKYKLWTAWAKMVSNWARQTPRVLRPK